MNAESIKPGMSVAVVLSLQLAVIAEVATTGEINIEAAEETLWRIIDSAGILIGYFPADRLSETTLPSPYQCWDHAQHAFVAGQALGLLSRIDKHMRAATEATADIDVLLKQSGIRL